MAGDNTFVVSNGKNKIIFRRAADGAAARHTYLFLQP